VGILLGDASNGIVDIDLDCLEAITLSHYLLPPTDMVFGRDSKPASHWIYRVPNAGKTEKFLDPDGGTLVELRSNGCYTVFPGSTHESGEEIRFYADDEPATIELGYLAACARHLAAASLILPHWLQGQRHSLALALSGILLRNGFGEEEAHQFIDAFVCASGDQESEDRHWCVRSTAINLKAGKACTGNRELTQIIGAKCADRVLGWLGSGSKEVVSSPASTTELARAYGGFAPQSDLANAERFARYNRDRARYSYHLKKWFTWDGMRWRADADGEIDRLANVTVKEAGIEAANHDDKVALDWAVKSHDLKRLRSMVTLAQSQCSIRLEAFDADPWKLNCRTGIIDLTSGEQLPHAAEALMSRLAPVDFDPEADCPTFKAFIDRILAGNAELIAFVQRAVGYSLTGRTNEQCLFLCVGDGANGKSTLIRVMQDLLGDYALQTPMEALMASRSSGIGNEIARLEGARFVAAVETEAGQRMAEAKIKQFTGSDKIAARFLYQEHFEFVPQFKIFVATNRLPEVRGTDEGIWRRLCVIPFDITIPEAERDGSLIDKLRDELPGILNWAIAGCLAWLKGGLQPPKSVLTAKQQYRSDMDQVALFIEDCCVTDPKAEETFKALFSRFNVWCEENIGLSISARDFGQRLRQLGHAERRTGRARMRRGIRLKLDAELLEFEASLSPEEESEATCRAEKRELVPA